MPTLEDAADALIVKLRGLDSEIEESAHRLAELRGQAEGAAHEVEQEWGALSEAVSSFLEAVREEQQRLDQQTQRTLEAAAAAAQAVAAQGAGTRSEIAESRAGLDALAEHAASLPPRLDTLATDAGEAPGHGLRDRAAQVGQELTRALEEARDFVRNEVVAGIEEAAQDVRDRCQALRAALAEEHAGALQAAFDAWEAKVDDLEEYVATKAFQASHRHAHDVVEYALGECGDGQQEQLDALQPLVDALGAELGALAAEAQRSTDVLVAQMGTDLGAGLDAGREAAAQALAALGAARRLLARYSFVEV